MQDSLKRAELIRKIAETKNMTPSVIDTTPWHKYSTSKLEAMLRKVAHTN
jgi:hypothetical protein